MGDSALGVAGLALLGVLAFASAILLFRVVPRAAFVVWCLVLFFVPVWIGAQVGSFFAAISMVTLAGIAANVTRMRFALPDLAIAGFAGLGAILFAVGQVSLSAIVTAVVEWVVPYVWGRIVASRVSSGFVFKAIAVCATFAAVLALLEFATGRNLFVQLPALGPSYSVWAPLQYRGGLLRAEGAFGHSIALGASLALSTAFVLAAAWRTRTHILMLVIIGAATVVTFSRIGLITEVITIALCVVLLHRLRTSTRIAVLIIAVVAALVVVPLISDVFLDAGAEAGGSADYRVDLLQLLPQLKPFGSSDDWSSVTANGTYLGSFAATIDNALLLIALRFGIVPALVLVLLLGAGIVSILIPHRATAASIGLVAQIPALFSVALITQYGMFLWFVGGLAVSLIHSRDPSGEQGGVSRFRVHPLALAPGSPRS
ncbi:hypothetical protein GCM10009840_33100 [Pseudolysinimonas kribbensis]|uniref:O-antigen ligase domain-containing protein n=1 Tax=Pseudolysinimonas kribbensis TaxID=433641 RepID=A0ABQ6K1F2_9MICO|nr:hypothetical protein [Pseudolysinimonas kribbensis]GMA93423.1 hypothetical protein GCM10025881_02470 [Pseudolysinimonas kribbensis]